MIEKKIYDVPFEPLYETCKTDANEIYFMFEDNLKKLCYKISYNNNVNFDDLFQMTYIYTMQACQRYDPYFNNNFKPLFAFVHGFVEQRLRAYTQRYWICANRTHPTDFTISDDDTGNDNTDDYKNVEDKMFVEYIFSFMNVQEKQIFDMYFFKNMRQQQIAEIMGIAQSQVCFVKNNFIKLINAMLKAQENNDKKTIAKLNKTILFRKRSNITRAKNK